MRVALHGRQTASSLRGDGVGARAPAPIRLLSIRLVAPRGVLRARHLPAAALAVALTLPLAFADDGAPRAEQAKAEAAPSVAGEPVQNPAPRPEDWANLAKLPDWSGVWNPNISDQFRQMATNKPPWRPEIAAKIAAQLAEDRAGRPEPIVVSCLPQGMPAWMLITHNAMEILFTPGRVTLLGESDGNRLRRIYTDGRGHPADGELTFHGHSIGRWEGDTLVVETVNIKPQTMFAISEAAGTPNNGGVRIIERIHLAEPDILADDLEIEAPHVLTRAWKTTRTWFRQRARKFDIVEGVCLEGNYAERIDKDGNHVFVEIARDPRGNIAAPQR
jgi:hypothetical protein